MKAKKTGGGGGSAAATTSSPSSSSPSSSLSSSSSSSSSITMQVDELAAVLRRHDLTEIELEQGGLRVRLRRGGDMPFLHAAAPIMAPLAHAAPAAPAAAPAAAAAPAGAPSPSKSESDGGNVSYITSPFVGTFYRSPGPDSAPFVDVGTRVRKAQVICIVEAMKLMNEIESEIDGVIVACLVENGQAVEYGEPLFKIKQG
jgi:acetyl-CoA carboxylase biotin carboxyl carrier protein